jgi:hypothetical protein
MQWVLSLVILALAELPLSTCYRCPDAVIESAKKQVPRIEAPVPNPRGRGSTSGSPRRVPEKSSPAMSSSVGRLLRWSSDVFRTSVTGVEHTSRAETWERDSSL